MAVLTERERARAMMVTLEVSEGGRKKKTLIIYKYIYAHKHSCSICGGNAQVYSGTRGRRCIHDVSIEPGIHRPTKLELVKMNGGEGKKKERAVNLRRNKQV